jgi:hypothetical protein
LFYFRALTILDNEDEREEMESFRSKMGQAFSICFGILKETYFNSLPPITVCILLLNIVSY